MEPNRFNIGSPIPDDLRSHGWVVASHNDYRQHGMRYTFWLFTRLCGDNLIALVGEGLSDTEALDIVRQKAEQYG